jgi:hypothetical protein
MYEFGEQMERARLRRLDPAATDAEIDAAISAWLRTRPDAPVGDASGPPVAPVRMNRLEAALRRAAEDLDRSGRPWACGPGGHCRSLDRD